MGYQNGILERDLYLALLSVGDIWFGKYSSGAEVEGSVIIVALVKTSIAKAADSGWGVQLDDYILQ